jgi:putative transcriptional regulator|tara:strand:+ start:2774 stop:3349 length:576 start_codon:yes stop_codon:yes gene_type:complete
LENLNLTGQFLIAMPSMTDPRFSQTISFICTHNEDGAMGIVLNRPSKYNVEDLLNQIELKITPSSLLEDAIYEGGPMQTDRGFVLHMPQQEYNSTIQINDNIALTTSKDILEAAADNQAPKKMIIALGYAGWSAGQLEEEMGQNAWLNLEATEQQALQKIIFDTPANNRFKLGMDMMGLNSSNLLDVAGHA